MGGVGNRVCAVFQGPVGAVLRRPRGRHRPRPGYASRSSGRGGSLRRDGPVSVIETARWTTRSRIASATVGSPR